MVPVDNIEIVTIQTDVSSTHDGKASPESVVQTSDSAIRTAHNRQIRWMPLVGSYGKPALLIGY